MGFDDVGMLLDQLRGDVAGVFQQVQILFQVGEAQHGDAALACTEKFAGAADIEVLAGDFKAVGVLVNHFEPRFGQFAQWFGKQ